MAPRQRQAGRGTPGPRDMLAYCLAQGFGRARLMPFMLLCGKTARGLANMTEQGTPGHLLTESGIGCEAHVLGLVEVRETASAWVNEICGLLDR